MLLGDLGLWQVANDVLNGMLALEGVGNDLIIGVTHAGELQLGHQADDIMALDHHAALRTGTRRGLTGVKLVISDAHEGLKAAITRVLSAIWQRCRVHFMRNALAYVPKGQNTVVAAAIRQVFLQPDHAAATQVGRQVAD